MHVDNREAAETKYVCKHCKVQVMDKNDHRPVLGREHKRCCPRRRTLG